MCTRKIADISTDFLGTANYLLCGRRPSEKDEKTQVVSLTTELEEPLYSDQGRREFDWSRLYAYDEKDKVAHEYNWAVLESDDAAGDGIPKSSSARNNNCKDKQERKKENVTTFALAADQENAAAQANLGIMYYNRDGVGQDQEQAAAWWRKAAELGNTEARKPLGSRKTSGDLGYLPALSRQPKVPPANGLLPA
jgi:hypothetical protein